MSEEVFISYCHENREAARILAETVMARGCSVWWDHALVAGDSYTEVIEQKLDEARAVIVIWSEHSRKSHWVRDEAAVGRDRNRLLPVAIDANPPPLGFRQIQTVDLQGWDGKDKARIEPLFLGLNGLLKTRDATAGPVTHADASNPFGGASAPQPEAKGGQVLAGVNARPNNKPVKQILREEKNQRGFFRTYWLTSFIISAIAAVVLGLVVPRLGVAEFQSNNLLAAAAGMFFIVGFGLFIGRALIIVGRRLSKRKSVRYFDSTTIIVMLVSLALTALIALIPTSKEGGATYTASENTAYAIIAGISILFPVCSLGSLVIGFFRGMGRTGYADGK